MKALQQCIVQVSCNTRTLSYARFQPDLEVSMKPSHTELICPPQQQQQKPCARNLEPYCLVIRRQNRQVQGSSGFVPNAVVIRGDDSETVFPGFQVSVEGLPPSSSNLPAFIVSFQHVLEPNLLRNSKAERSVVDLQVACP